MLGRIDFVLMPYEPRIWMSGACFLLYFKIKPLVIMAALGGLDFIFSLLEQLSW